MACLFWPPSTSLEKRIRRSLKTNVGSRGLQLWSLWESARGENICTHLFATALIFVSRGAFGSTFIGFRLPASRVVEIRSRFAVLRVFMSLGALPSWLCAHILPANPWSRSVGPGKRPGGRNGALEASTVFDAATASYMC